MQIHDGIQNDIIRSLLLTVYNREMKGENQAICTYSSRYFYSTYRKYLDCTDGLALPMNYERAYT